MIYRAGDVRKPEPSRSRKAISTGLFVFASIALHSLSYGSVVVFDNESSFLMTGLVVSTETFDQLQPNAVMGTGNAVLDGITYTSDQAAAQWIAGIHIHQVPPQYISPPNDFGANLIGTNTLTFENAGSTNAIGFYIITAGVLTTYNITVTTTTGQTWVEPLIFAPNPSFRGFISSEGITSVAVMNAFPQNTINYSFDNVSRGEILATPEPYTLLTFTGGLASIALCAALKKCAPRNRCFATPDERQAI
jgi:hypothetical protein